MDWIRRHLKVIVPFGVAIAALVAVLAFGVFGVHTLFLDDRVDEAAPVFAAELDPTTATAADTSTGDTSASAATDVPTPAAVAPPPSTADIGTVPTPDTAPVVPQVVTLASGMFVPRSHPGEGRVTVLNDGSSQRFLRFEDFATDNGPDLNVYLTTSDANAAEGTFDDDFVDLGTLSGNIGDQNYEVPPDVDLAVYDTVVVWCVRFSVAFTAADLVAA